MVRWCTGIALILALASTGYAFAQDDTAIEQARVLVLDLARSDPSVVDDEDFVLGVAFVMQKYPDFMDEVNAAIAEGERSRDGIIDTIRNNPSLLEDPEIKELLSQQPELSKRAHEAAEEAQAHQRREEDKLVAGVRANPSHLEIEEVQALRDVRPDLWVRLTEAAAQGRQDEEEMVRIIESDPGMLHDSSVQKIMRDRPELAPRFESAAERGRLARASNVGSGGSASRWDGTYSVLYDYQSNIDAHDHIYKIECGGTSSRTSIVHRGGKYWEGYHSYSTLAEAGLAWCRSVQ